MRFTLKQLEYFVAVADAGTIAAAADRVHVSSPSISVAISQLEEELAVQLFARQSTGLQLTPVGHDLLKRARAILDDSRGLYDVGNMLGGQLRGKISVGCLITLAPLVLPEVCQSFCRLHPAVTVDLIEGTQDQIVGFLRRSTVDVAITYEMHIPKDLWFEALVGLPPLVMMSADHHLAVADSVNMQELANEPYLLLDLPFSRDYFLSLFDKVGVVPNVRMRTTHFEVLRTLVANNYGVSIAVSRPRNEAALDGTPIVSRPISTPLPLLNLGTLSRYADLTHVAAAMKKHIHTLIGPNSVPGMRHLE